MPAAVITDHGHIHGWPEHEKACEEAGIKAIYGMEAYQARKTRFDTDPEERAGQATNEWEQRGPYHLTIMAKNNVGYNNIIKLSSRAYTEGYFVKGRIDHGLIQEHSEGLVVLSGCLGGEVQQALLRGDKKAALVAATTMQEIVGAENYFIELHDHGLPEQKQVKDDLIAIAKYINAPIIPSADCHYVTKEESANHDALLCISTGATLSQEKRFRFEPEQFFLKSREEMLADFEPEWLDNTMALADMCNVELKRGEYHFPKFVPPDNQGQEEFLTNMVWTGLKEIYGDPLPEHVVERAEYELRVITKAGFIPYFLIVHDIIDWAKRNGIRVGDGRGSVTASVIAYGMGITGIDPFKYDLLFERFLIEGRSTMPDIDIDFDDRRRDEVIEYVKSKYGSDHVANIVTFSKMKARSAIQDAGRILGHDFPATNKIANMVPPPINGVSKTLEECMMDKDFSDLYESDPVAKEIIDIAIGLEGTFRQTGVHASGILITDKPVTEYVPVLQKNEDGKRGPVVTQWVGEDIEANGLLKIDFLGLKNLSIIDICLENIKSFRGIDLDMSKIDMEDEATFDLYRGGHTVSCFQVGNDGMRNLMIDMKPDNIKDVMALISLFRPGPMGPGMHRMYVDRKFEREPVDYIHPLLKEELKDTYGVLVYQEQVMNAARILAGFSAAEADDLRKAMGKKKPEVMEKVKQSFVDGCMKTNGISAYQAEKVFKDIEYFAGYGFGLGHAASYAELSYKTAYLKANYPVEYMAAVLDSEAGSKKSSDDISIYLSEAKRMGLTILPPSVTKSESTFKVLSDEEILFGLSGIGGLGPAVLTAILEDTERASWHSISDIFKRANHAVLNKKVIESLLYAGALDDLIPHEDIDYSELDLIDMLSKEKNKLGIFLTDNPVDRFGSTITKMGSHSVEKIQNTPQRTRVKIAGMISAFEERKTRAGKKMWTFNLIDQTGVIPGFCYDSIIDELPSKLQNDKFYILECAAAFDRADHTRRNLVLYNYEEVDMESVTDGRAMEIHVDKPIEPWVMDKIAMLLEENRGKKKLNFIYHLGNTQIVTEYKYKVREEVYYDIMSLL